MAGRSRAKLLPADARPPPPPPRGDRLGETFSGRQPPARQVRGDSRWGDRLGETAAGETETAGRGVPPRSVAHLLSLLRGACGDRQTGGGPAVRRPGVARYRPAGGPSAPVITRGKQPFQAIITPRLIRHRTARHRDVFCRQRLRRRLTSVTGAHGGAEVAGEWRYRTASA